MFLCTIITQFLGVYSRSSAFQDLKDSLQPFIDSGLFHIPSSLQQGWCWVVGVGLGLGWVGLGREDYCKVLSQRQSAAN